MGRTPKQRKRRKQRPAPNERATNLRSPDKTALAVVTGFALVVILGTVLWLWNRSEGPGKAHTAEDRAHTSVAAQFVDAAVCKGCHNEIWQTYRETGMARSFYRPAADNTVEDYDAGEPFHHEASDRYYLMTRRDGRYFQRRYQKDSRGRETNVLEKEIHFVMGSGNHARSYLHLSQLGKLTQLPLGWYAEDGGRWGMSPGYDRPNHDGFQRVVSFDCMFCHNGYPVLEAGADRIGKFPVYTGSIPEGIDCQRCHGPGSAHVEAALSDTTSSGDLESSIVNPAKLPADRRMEVCLQCHLESTSRPLPNVIHKYGRGYFSFRPGQALADYALSFDHAPNTGWDNKFEINHSAYRLRQSKCFVESGETMTCTTCHDPHRRPSGEESSRKYDEACLSCHESRLQALAAQGGHSDSSGCTVCHMPQRRTDDVVHAVMTDHLIQAVPPAGLLDPKTERSTLADTAYRGAVELYYPESLPNPSDELYLALAQVAQGSNLERGIVRLESAIARRTPSQAGFYFELAVALEKTGRLDESSLWYQRALDHDPSFGLARTRLGSVLSRAGKHRQAQEVLGYA